FVFCASGVISLGGAGGVAGSAAFSAAAGFALGFVGGLIFGVAGIYAAVMIGAAGMHVFGVLDNNLQARRASRASLILLLGLVFAYAALLWVYLFEGWLALR
ncbi:MAG: hypothetical protein GYB67_07090, partial [Chloroflexi bacterium]|nr:hypothetical protein [Chloroflexota bacterium]